MLKIFLKFAKLSRSFLVFVCPLGEKFPAWASHSWSRPTRPRTVGEYEYCLFPRYDLVILLQIVMVSPGTHLVKNQKSQLKKKESEIENACAFM